MKKKSLNEEISRIKNMMGKLLGESSYGAAGWEGNRGDVEYYSSGKKSEVIPNGPTYTEENKKAVDLLEYIIKNYFKNLDYDAVEPNDDPNNPKLDIWSTSIFSRNKEDVPPGYYNFNIGFSVFYDKHTKIAEPRSVSISAEPENLDEPELYYRFKGSDPNLRYFGSYFKELNGYTIEDIIEENWSDYRNYQGDQHHDDNFDGDDGF